MAELLSVPLKKSSDVDIVKPLKNLLQSTYNSGESHEDYSDVLNELSQLRTAAIWKVFEKSSLDVLYNYYDQLVSLESKVPPQEVQIPFKWKDAFDKGSIFGGRMSLTVSSLSYERLCVLFNIAALQSGSAAQQPLDTEDSLKLAAKLLQQAAGALAQVKGGVLAAVQQEPTPDLAPDTLDALAKLMLAQAQEVIVYKCIRDEMKDSMVAKVCGGAEELYTDALRAMQKDQVKHLWERDWISNVQAKQTAFRGLTQLYQSMECQARGAVGEQIARLQIAAECLRGATARLRAAAALGEQGARAARLLAAALRDNDFIYHERVPEPGALEAPPRAVVAKPAPPAPAPGARLGSGADLFARLVPLRVAGALAGAEARRAARVQAEVARLRDATQLLNSVLASLNLPAAVERPAPGQLPPSIRDKAAAVRAAGGAAALLRLMDDLPDLLRRNTDILDEAERMLREEAEADAALRRQFGARWTRTDSAQLTDGFRRNGDKYRQIIDNAVRADRIVRDKFDLHRKYIELLSGSEGEVAAGVPAESGGAGAGAGGEAEASELRDMLQEVERLKSSRDALEAELKGVTLELRERLLLAAPHEEEALVAAALHDRLAPLSDRVDRSLQQQEELCERVRRGAEALARARGDGAERGAALGALAAAHDAYQELTANLTEGTNFYNDLTQLLLAYQNKVSDFCFARKTEKEELLKDLTQEAARSPAPPAPQEPAAVKREAPARPPPPAPAAAPAAASTSLPYPTQPQGMPLPYGASAAYPYYAAPMPTAYNPYATLPYPHHAARLPPPPHYQPYQHPPPPAGGYPQAPPPGYNPYPQQ